MGPYPTPSSRGTHYFLTLVDYFSKAVWVYILRLKTEVYKCFRHFFAMIDHQFETHVNGPTPMSTTAQKRVCWVCRF